MYRKVKMDEKKLKVKFIHICIDEELHNKFKIFFLQEGESMSNRVRKFIQQVVQNSERF